MPERSESTISRELVRNRGRGGYRPKQARGMAVERRSMSARTIAEATWQFAQEKLMQQWSPEQFSAHAGISPETVYQRVYGSSIAAMHALFLRETTA